MKNNIDLTSNRDFRLKAKEIEIIRPIILPSFDISLIYKDRFGVLSDFYYIGVDTGGIWQGGAKERESKRFCENLETCFCCGRELKPYDNNCLCSLCSQIVEYSSENLFSRNIL